MGPGWFNELGSWIYLRTHISLSPIRRGFAPGFVNYKKGALDSQPQVIKLTSCLSMVGGSPRVLRLLPPLKLVAMMTDFVCLLTYEFCLSFWMIARCSVILLLPL